MDNLNQLENETNIFVKKLLNPGLWMDVGWIVLKILLIILLTGLIIRIARTMIANLLKVRRKGPVKISERREATLVKLLQNTLTYVISFISFVTILSTLTIDVKGILAGAGIIGVAVGFGAQSLVKDVIAGFFIIFEDQFSVGDIVRINSFEGTVEEIGIRTTKILNWTGELHIVPNGGITEVTNFSIYNNTAIIDIDITYNGNIDELSNLIEDHLMLMPSKYMEITRVPKLLGLEQFNGDALTFRLIAETAPAKKEYVARQLRKELKILLDVMKTEREITEQGE